MLGARNASSKLLKQAIFASVSYSQVKSITSKAREYSGFSLSYYGRERLYLGRKAEGESLVAEGGILVTNHLLVEWGFYTVRAFVLSTKTVSTKYLRAKVYIDRFAALVLGGLGARLLLIRQI